MLFLIGALEIGPKIVQNVSYCRKFHTFIGNHGRLFLIATSFLVNKGEYTSETAYLGSKIAILITAGVNNEISYCREFARCSI